MGLLVAGVTYAYAKSVGSSSKFDSQEREALRKSFENLEKSKENLQKSVVNLENLKKTQVGQNDNSLTMELKKGLENVKNLKLVSQEQAKKFAEIVTQSKNVIKSEKSKIILNNETPEITSEKLKNTIQILEEQFKTIFNARIDTEKAYASADNLITMASNKLSSFPNAIENKKIIAEMTSINEEIKKSSQSQSKEIVEIIDQMIAVRLDNNTKLMTKEDRIKVLAPYANNPKYAHLVPKF
jgi:hypothetical protein